MEKHFRLAHKWGCVLLLDEADVFLAKRNVINIPSRILSVKTNNETENRRQTQWLSLW
jgi:hypothetical protein